MHYPQPAGKTNRYRVPHERVIPATQTGGEIVITWYPKQGAYLNQKVLVCFDYNTNETILGHIVRDDKEEPGRTIIALADGRFVLSTECQWRLI
jgi:hypothetical protein